MDPATEIGPLATEQILQGVHDQVQKKKKKKRALIQQPKVLLVDEMSMGLAPLVVETLFSTIRSIARDHGAAVVLVEQHVTLALEVADQAAVLNRGAVVLQGSAAELREQSERLERAYFGEAEPSPT